ncbi:MAG: hypothetical protein ACK40I_00710 [Tabrizicola sp.]
MFDGPASERTAEELGAVLSLIEASADVGDGRQVMAWRIDSKVALRALLHQARIARDPKLAETAAARADALAAQCRAMILS